MTFRTTIWILTIVVFLGSLLCYQSLGGISSTRIEFWHPTVLRLIGALVILASVLLIFTLAKRNFSGAKLYTSALILILNCLAAYFLGSISTSYSTVDKPLEESGFYERYIDEGAFGSSYQKVRKQQILPGIEIVKVVENPY